MKRTIALLMFIASSAAADDAGKLSMTEGQWELLSDVTMESAGGKQQSGAAQPSKLCLTKKSPVPIDPKSAPTGMTCSIHHTVTGNAVAWTTTCKGKSSSSQGSGTVTYAGNTFAGSSEAVVKLKAGADVKIAITMSGKYLGACPK